MKGLHVRTPLKPRGMIDGTQAGIDTSQAVYGGTLRLSGVKGVSINSFEVKTHVCWLVLCGGEGYPSHAVEVTLL